MDIQGNQIDKVRKETTKRGQYYFGRIAIYENGKRLYTIPCGIARLSRGDAMRDASIAATQFLLHNF